MCFQALGLQLANSILFTGYQGLMIWLLSPEVVIEAPAVLEISSPGGQTMWSTGTPVMHSSVALVFDLYYFGIQLSAA